MLMGHSFGGGSALAAAEKTQAKAIMVFDPWLFAVHKEKGIKAGPAQKTCVVMSEKWEPSMAKWSKGELTTPGEVAKYSR
jgi:dienelactone hydrolase